MKNRLLLLGLLALMVFGCQPNHNPEPLPGGSTEWVSRPDGFQQNYALDQLVILSRHNIRSPLVSKQSVLTRLTNSEYQWFQWEGAPSTLTAKGERLESRMGGFFREWLEKKDFLSRYSADQSSFRFYANAKQRCQLTARTFADALLPGLTPRVEMNVAFDTMDPVFNPQITKLSEGFVNQARQEIRTRFGEDLNAGASASFQLLESVIDITHSPAYPDTSSFSQFPSSVSFKLNAEPALSGGLKMACSLSDALALQYYEEPDAKKAAFGKTLTEEDWVSITSITQRYEDILFSAPSVSLNVAHPLLQTLLSEMQNEKRIFSFLCGHDSNILSVLSALDVQVEDLPGSIEKRTPIGCKLIFERFTGADGLRYADLLLVYASASQLRAETTFSYTQPPMAVKLKLKGLNANADGLYTLADLQQRISQALVAYDQL